MRVSEDPDSPEKSKNNTLKLQGLQKLAELSQRQKQQAGNDQKDQKEHGIYAPASADTPFDAFCKELLKKYDIDEERAARLHQLAKAARDTLQSYTQYGKPQESDISRTPLSPREQSSPGDQKNVAVAQVVADAELLTGELEKQLIDGYPLQAENTQLLLFRRLLDGPTPLSWPPVVSDCPLAHILVKQTKMMEFLDLNAQGVAGDIMSPEGEGKRYFFQNSFRFAAIV